MRGGPVGFREYPFSGYSVQIGYNLVCVCEVDCDMHGRSKECVVKLWHISFGVFLHSCL
jgi:hypothetical protein